MAAAAGWTVLRPECRLEPLSKSANYAMSAAMPGRRFATLLVVAAAGLSACQSSTQVPLIGILSVTVPEHLPAFYDGLKAGGFVEGVNVVTEHREAGGRPSRLRDLANDLVNRKVAAIVTTGGINPARAAKAATSTIPIVFTTGEDPVLVQLVASLSRPGGNATGISLNSTQLTAKRLELMRDLVPGIRRVALLTAPRMIQAAKDHMTQATRAAGVEVISLDVGIDANFEAAFAAAVDQHADAMIVSAVPFFMRDRSRIIALAAAHKLPVVYPWREFTDDGGLMSYAPNLEEIYRQMGLYTARILRGAAPAELPVLLPTRFELVVNLKTAGMMGLSVPRVVNARADRVIQ
jgi:putative ABC transport system substrate-binding protein